MRFVKELLKNTSGDTPLQNQSNLETVNQIFQSFDECKNLDELLGTAAEKIPEFTHFDSAMILSFDPTEALLELKASSNNMKIYGEVSGSIITEDVRSLTNPIVKAIKNNIPTICSNFHECFKNIIQDEELIKLEKVVSSNTCIALPINSGPIPQGAIVLISSNIKVEQIGPKLIKLLTTICKYLAVQIENKRLLSDSYQTSDKLKQQYNELQIKNKEIDAIFRITNQMITTFNPEEVAQRAVDSVLTELEYVGAVVSRINSKKNNFEILAMTNFQRIEEFKDYLIKKEVACKYKPGFKPEMVAYNLENFMVSDNLKEAFSTIVPEEYSHEVQEILNIKTIVNVPIITMERVIGVITFFFDKPEQKIYDTEYDLMQTFANQIAIGLENARLFNVYQELTTTLAEKNIKLEEYAEKERDILDIMGHELRTPISIVRNSLSFLHNELSKEDHSALSAEKLKHYVEIGLRSANREINIIETMLAATKVEASRLQIQREEVEISEVIEESLEGQKANAQKKNLEIILNIEQGIPNVFADRSRIQEITDNLLSNAVKYTVKGHVEISAKREDDFVRVSFKDTGIGIPKENLKEIGTKFYRVNQHISESEKESSLPYNVVRPGGTGLGLYVTFNLINLHGGEVDVQSEHGKGSTFSFTMPRYEGQTPEVGSEEAKDLLLQYKEKIKSKDGQTSSKPEGTVSESTDEVKKDG